MKHRTVAASLLASCFAIALAIFGVVLGSRGVAQAQTAAQSSPAPLVHQVRSGESLWSIAELRLGNSRLWPLVYRANRDQIMDPARLFVGQRLNIPQLSEEEKKAALSSATLPQTLKPILATPPPASAAQATPSTDPAAVAPPASSIPASDPSAPQAPAAPGLETPPSVASPSEPARIPSADSSTNTP